MNGSTARTLLRVRDLRTYFHTDSGVVKAVDGVSFRVEEGRTFALVGESGCGKSVTALSILRLLPVPPGRIESGTVEMGGRDLLTLTERQMRHVRGGQISIVFQEPMTSLNPVLTCGQQIVEAVRLHQGLLAGAARRRAVGLLARVGIAEPARRFGEYPHQMSGGMRQRVMIAMALACDGRLLIADEPTTALDVTVQAQVLDLLKDIQRERGLGILLITHDLAVVAQVAHTVAVMYASKIVEHADVAPLFAQPLHPYTRGLLRSLPRLGERKTRLETIGGSVPDPLALPAGCRFHPRCALCREVCREREPSLREVQPAHWCACWLCPGWEAAKGIDPSPPEKPDPRPLGSC